MEADKIADSIPNIIGAAAASDLGMLALFVIALSFLAYFFFSSASEKVKVGIFTLLFFGVVGFGVAIFRAKPFAQSVTTKTQTFSINTPCREMKRLPGRVWKVACNDYTAAGYYWEVKERVGEYGHWGLVATLEGSPKCMTPDDVGGQGQTWAWKITEPEKGFEDVAFNICRGFEPTNTQHCDVHQGDHQGPIYPCPEEHCGIYRAVCRKVEAS